ncbi:hypothetical protein OG233_14005 [Streptomyces sp. NBC_01218]|uniref:hypothetical protein n=1 Tax=Streptomyces sp. NBC_01218 TaxID=2903780 RepID=UPI002E0FE481|nr:hypothetical protein OG233_14005 [Streptomyces sp. NBC_01218]
MGTPDGEVLLYLPEVTYLDTQVWSVDVGLTGPALVELRDAIDNHLRVAEGHAGPANRGEDATVALRDQVRLALRRHIDADDDTMPTLDGTGTFLWVPADEVLDDLVAAVTAEPKYPITSHPYQGDRFLHPCTARGYGSMCGATEYDHQEGP